MLLPIPFKFGDELVDQVEIQTPRAGILADTEKVASQGRHYSSLVVLVAGCLAEENAKALARAMPYRDAEWAALQAIMLISPDDGFEGVYECPRCGDKQVTEDSKDDDTRDFVSQMAINYLGEPGSAELDLVEPVEIYSGDELKERVDSMTIGYPTLAQCEAGEKRSGGMDPLRQQFSIYTRAIEQVNGADVDDGWRNRWADLVFERMSARDVQKLGELMSFPGLQRTIEKRCRGCGKVWQAPVNTSGFFESALHSAQKL